MHSRCDVPQTPRQQWTLGNVSATWRRKDQQKPPAMGWKILKKNNRLNMMVKLVPLVMYIRFLGDFSILTWLAGGSTQEAISPFVVRPIVNDDHMIHSSILKSMKIPRIDGFVEGNEYGISLYRFFFGPNHYSVFWFLCCHMQGTAGKTLVVDMFGYQSLTVFPVTWQKQRKSRRPLVSNLRKLWSLKC